MPQQERCTIELAWLELDLSFVIVGLQVLKNYMFFKRKHFVSPRIPL